MSQYDIDDEGCEELSLGSSDEEGGLTSSEVTVTPDPTDADETLALIAEPASSNEEGPKEPTVEVPSDSSPEEDYEFLSGFMETMGVAAEKTVVIKKRPWMASHKFVLVRTADELSKIVDRAIAEGKCALDLETQGLDTRIYYRKVSSISDTDFREVDSSLAKGEGPEATVPQMVHKVVGYCMCYDGLTGYYIPVRHTGEGGDANIHPVEAAREIRRLCRASQPVLTEEEMGRDPLSGREMLTPPRLKILFWHAKFDQEFLYPITGIDYWHPDSFEDAMLAYFCRYTSDKQLSLKHKSAMELRTKEGNHPYEMIELKELFVTSSGKKREVLFATLHPEEAYDYGCSDGICTYLHCVKPNIAEYMSGNIADSDKDRKKKLAIYRMYRIEKQVAQVLRGLERIRANIDIKYVRELLKEAKEEADGYEAEIKALAHEAGFPGFEVRSAKQLGEFLFGDNGLGIKPTPEKNEKSGQFKTDADTLEAWAEHPGANPILLKVVKYRQIDKVVSTYLESMVANSYDPQGGKNPDVREIRYQFKQTGASTARFSCPAGEAEQGYSGVPIHGIPSTYDDKKPKVATSLRKIFTARPGYVMIKIDFAGEELRIATNVSKEPVWTEEFLHGSGDLHSITARAFFNKTEVSKQERQQGKCVHPNTLVWNKIGLTTVGSLGFFNAKEDTFLDAKGELYDGTGLAPLTALYTGGKKELVHVVTNTGVVTCTPEHKFQLENDEWVRAGSLSSGMQLKGAEVPRLPAGEEQTPPWKSWLRESRVPFWAMKSRTLAKIYLEKLFSSEPSGRVFSTGDLVFAGQVSTLVKACGFQPKVRLIEGQVQIAVHSFSDLALFSRDCSTPTLVSKVIPAGLDYCVDVTVGNEEHKYLANGFVTHNTANFALLYGGGAASIVRATGCSTVEGQRRKKNFDEALPTFAKWVRSQKEICKRDKGVYSPFGRWIYLPEIDSQDGAIRSGAERNAINAPVQCGGADIMKIAMILLHREMYKKRWLPAQDDKVHMLLTVHDELVFEVAYDIIEEAMELFLHCMTEPGRMMKWVVPLIAEPLIDTSWDAKYDWDNIMVGREKAPKGVDKDDLVQFEGKWYQKPPAFLDPHINPPWRKAGMQVEPSVEKPKEVKAPKAAAPKAATSAKTGTSKPAPAKVPEKGQRLMQEVVKGEPFVYKLPRTTPNSTLRVMEAVTRSRSSDGSPLHLVNLFNETLIEPDFGIMVDPVRFADYLREHDL